MTIGTALIGFGSAGRLFHAPLIRATQGLELRSIVRRRPHADDTVGDARVVATADEVFRDPVIDLVVIATPNDSHFELAKCALESGRHVVVDKPITVQASEARELIAVAAAHSRVLAPFHNRRWDADFLTVRGLASSGALGRIVSLESRFDRLRAEPRAAAWRDGNRPGAGLLFDLGPHLIDQALQLFGAPSRISASVRLEREGSTVDDAFDLWLHYPDRLAILRAGMLVRETAPRFILRGTAGTFVKSGFDMQESGLRSGIVPGGPSWGRETREQWGTLYTDAGAAPVESAVGNYLAFYENVRDAIHGTAPLAATAEDALRVIEIIETAHAYARSG